MYKIRNVKSGSKTFHKNPRLVPLYRSFTFNIEKKKIKDLLLQRLNKGNDAKNTHNFHGLNSILGFFL